MTKRLWFDFPATLRVAEYAASCHTFTGSGRCTTEPCLLIDTGGLGVLRTNGRSTEPAPAPVTAIHVDGATDQRRADATPAACPPLRDLTEPGNDLLHQLRHHATGGAAWFTVDIHRDATIDHAVHHTQEVTTVPDDATWVAAQVAAGDLGPYPAQVARGYHRPGGFAFARFSRDVAWWIALDLRCLPAGQHPTEAVRVSGEEVGLIRHPGTGQDRAEPLTADPGGWWRIDGDAWPWTVTDDGEFDTAGNERPLSQMCGPDGDQERCTVCHAVDEIDHDEMPSMVGYGNDTSSRCRRCGSTETTDPMFGAHPHPATWPPSRARQNELDGQSGPDTADGARS